MSHCYLSPVPVISAVKSYKTSLFDLQEVLYGGLNRRRRVRLTANINWFAGLLPIARQAAQVAAFGEVTYIANILVVPLPASAYCEFHTPYFVVAAMFVTLSTVSFNSVNS